MKRPLSNAAKFIRKSINFNKMHIILDNGHGGIIDGVYQTAGKRSPKWSDGRQLFEGVFNRAIVKGLHELCKANGIKSTILVPELRDTSLSDRVRRANKIYSEDKSAILISVHANAGGGTGFEMFTSIGETKSDKIATILIEEYAKSIPELRLRKDTSDGDEDKEAHFYIIKQTACPAVLIECAFMDTLNPDCEMLMSEETKFINAIFNGIKRLK